MFHLSVGSYTIRVTINHGQVQEAVQEAEGGEEREEGEEVKTFHIIGTITKDRQDGTSGTEVHFDTTTSEEEPRYGSAIPTIEPVNGRRFIPDDPPGLDSDW